MLTLYFSGTGNSRYVAKLFSKGIGAKAVSIEEEVDFGSMMLEHDVIAFCYPIYGSRVPLIMRQFVDRHMDKLKGKDVIIFVTQMMFSGDGARVLTDLFPKGHIKVIYAEHFLMPNNIGNFPLFKAPSQVKVKKCIRRAKVKLRRICKDINNGVIRKRGFNPVAKLLGKIQGSSWQGDSSMASTTKGSMERKAKDGVFISSACTACGLCIKLCPMKNLDKQDGIVIHKSNCTMCYRCVNHCPQKAITTFLHRKVKWQYSRL